MISCFIWESITYLLTLESWCLPGSGRGVLVIRTQPYCKIKNKRFGISHDILFILTLYHTHLSFFTKFHPYKATRLLEYLKTSQVTID